MALLPAVKTALQSRKDRSEQDRAAAIAANISSVAAWAAREKKDMDRAAAAQGDSLT